MNVNPDNIMDYINYDTGIPKEKTLQSSLIMFGMLGIPCSLFGAYSNITRIILLPLIILLSLWAIYMMISKKSKKCSFILFLGVFSFFTSILFMISSYKIALLAYNVSHINIFQVILLYIVSAVLNILNVIRLIQKRYYSSKDKKGNLMPLFMATSILGLSMGKMIKDVKTEVIIAIMVSMMLFMSFMALTGTHNFLKYYYVVKSNKSKNQ